ncbi:MAG: 2-phospho-L-lactate guanylyltransferase [Candidatus Dadabacteria bacterium]|nr:2-phospho-L-lactate guanylyltransferase [Candidatus Dadabacteria bacterium]
MKFVIVPVKDLTKAKDRMSGFLTGAERKELVLAMLRDMLGALKRSELPERCLVVTIDERVCELSKELGFDLIIEKDQRGESASVDEASLICAEMGATSVLRIPGDIPLITPLDIDFILDRPLPQPSVIIVPSRDRFGTNAILQTPPNVIRSQFGRDSLRKHIEDAKRFEIPYSVIENPRIGLDVDEPEDLRALVTYYNMNDARSSNTLVALRKLGIADRVEKLKLTG